MTWFPRFASQGASALALLFTLAVPSAWAGPSGGKAGDTNRAIELPVDAGFCAIYRALTDRVPAECPSIKAGSQARSIVPRQALTADVDLLTQEPAESFVIFDLPAPEAEAESGTQVATIAIDRPVAEPPATSVPRSLRYTTNAVEPSGRGKGAAAYFIHFAFDSAEIGADYRQHLASLSKVLQTNLLKNTCLRVVGHTDSVGSADYNLALSELRAGMVRDFLVKDGGIPEARVLTTGSGEQTPLDGVDPMHPQNRRVEFQIRETTGGC